VIADVLNEVIRVGLTTSESCPFSPCRQIAPPTANRVPVKPFHWNKPMK
jgi:hypothetical protein